VIIWVSKKDSLLERIGKNEISDDSDLLTGALYAHYSPPRGFCFDILCGDEPINDDKTSADYNVDDRVSRTVEIVKFLTFVGFRLKNSLSMSRISPRSTAPTTSCSPWATISSTWPPKCGSKTWISLSST
jgi:hypothetical protein